MSMETGSDLLHYRLVEKIGEGGMGVVWRALDRTLDREVAIKVLTDAWASDSERIARLEREARVLASLNHPNIASIYGLHEADGVRFLVMELIPGEDLAESLARGPLAVEDAIATARGIATALEAAHDMGVIHRDLKPANVKRTPDGAIKVLDFGLAKALDPSAASGSNPAMTPTLTSAGTMVGTILGTAAYMSPEQAKGRAVDRRADIWAFGCVLHEMLTGRRLFEGETVSEIVASVLKDPLTWDGYPESTPRSLIRLLERCLDRDPRTRLRDIGEARIALERAAAGADEPVGAAAPGATGAGGTVARSGRERLAWAIAAIAIVAAAAIGAFGVLRDEGPARRQEVRASILPPDGLRLSAYASAIGGLTVSPDGTRMTFMASDGKGGSVASLFVRLLSSETAQPIPDSEGASFPFWSPDSRQIAFFAGGALKKFDLEGGAPMTVCAAPDGRGGSWNRDGDIVFAPDTNTTIHRVSAGGGTPVPVTVLDAARGGESTHRHPVFLPDGRTFLYLRASHAAARTESVNAIWVGSLDSDETRELVGTAMNVAYGAGHLFHLREQFLMARPFDPTNLTFEGDPFVVAEDIMVEPDFFRGAFDVSEDGTIVYQHGMSSGMVLQRTDRAGAVREVVGQPGQYTTVRLSPDATRLAMTVAEPGSGQDDLWILDLARGSRSRVTFDLGSDQEPVWSPDGSRIAFVSTRSGTGDIYVRSADGQGQAELLYASDQRDAPADWSPDGRFLAIDRGGGKNDIWIVPMDDGEPYAFVESDYDVGYSRFSPDGTALAYLSSESGRYELYLTRFPGGDGKWQLSADGADWLVGWKRDGSALYFLDLQGAMCEVEVRLDGVVEAGVPRKLFPTRARRTWAAFPDGEQFLVGASETSDAEYPIIVVLGWDGS